MLLPVAAEILFAASGNELASGPVIQIRLPGKLSLRDVSTSGTDFFSEIIHPALFSNIGE